MRRRHPIVVGVGYAVLLSAYAVGVGIGPTVVRDPSPRVPGVLFAAVFPFLLAVGVSAGATVLWRRAGLRAPTVVLVVGTLVAMIVVPRESSVLVLLVGSVGWLSGIAALERTWHAVDRWRSDAALSASDRATVLGVAVGTVYTALVVGLAAIPAWTRQAGAPGPGAVEIALTVAFLFGAHCLLLGGTVAVFARYSVVSPLVPAAAWVLVGVDALRGPAAGEVAVVAYIVAWPVIVVLAGLFALGERAVRLQVDGLGLRSLVG